MKSPLRIRRMRGLAVVEATIALPLFLMIMLSAAEFGRMMYQYNALTKSVRDAAGVVAAQAINGTTGVIDITSDLVTKGRNLAVYGVPTGGGRPVLIGYETNDVSVTALDANHIQVSASYTYQPLFSLIPTFGYGGDGINTSGTFTASCRMRAL